MANNIIRSFRYDEFVETVLLKARGDNLNQKFINLIHHCFEDEKSLNKRISQKQAELKNIEDKIELKRNELYNLDSLLRSGKDLKSALTQIAIKACEFNSKL